MDRQDYKDPTKDEPKVRSRPALMLNRDRDGSDRVISRSSAIGNSRRRRSSLLSNSSQRSQLSADGGSSRVSDPPPQRPRTPREGQQKQRPAQRARRRNSTDSQGSYASAAIKLLEREINDLKECARTELDLAEHEMQKLRAENGKFEASVHDLEELIETASTCDGNFDIEEALQQKEEASRQRSGGISSGIFSDSLNFETSMASIPVEIEMDLKDSASDELGNSSAATNMSLDQAAMMVLEGTLNERDDDDDMVMPPGTFPRRPRGRGRNRLNRQISNSSDHSVEDRMDYAQEKIRRIRSRSGSRDPTSRKPRRATRKSRRNAADAQSVGTDIELGFEEDKRSRSRSLDPTARRHRSGRRSTGTPQIISFRNKKLEEEAIAKLKDELKEKKRDIRRAKERLEMQLESTEENAQMMGEVTGDQTKKIERLKVDIVSLQAHMRFRADRLGRGQNDKLLEAAAIDELMSLEDRQALHELQASRKLIAGLRARVDKLEDEERQSNTEQADLLKRIPQARAEGLVLQTKRRIEVNKQQVEALAQKKSSELAKTHVELAKMNSNRVVEELSNMQTNGINGEGLCEFFAAQHEELKSINTRLSSGIKNFTSLTKIPSELSKHVRDTRNIWFLGADAVGALEIVESEVRELYAFVRIIRSRAEETFQLEEQIKKQNAELLKLRQELAEKKRKGTKVATPKTSPPNRKEERRVPSSESVENVVSAS